MQIGCMYKGTELLEGVQVHYSIFGKEIYVYDPGIICDESSIKKFLSKLSAVQLLRKLADTALKHEMKSGPSFYNGIPIDTYLVIRSAEYTVHYADEQCNDEISSEQYLIFLKMIFSITNSERLTKSENMLSLLVLTSNQHFPSQENQFSELARCYLLFGRIWQGCIPNMDIGRDIEDITGVQYPALILHTYAILGKRESYFWPYEAKKLNSFAEKTGVDFTLETQNKYLEWASCNIDQARRYRGSLLTFKKYPIFHSNFKPLENKEEVFIKISGQQLHKKSTIGIYYELSEKYAGDRGKNPFREAFGHVFQEYVGQVLKEYFHSWNVNEEITYRKNKSKHQSVDWLVWKGKKAILIEAKQNALGYNAKYSGELNSIRSDISRNIGKAFSQLETTIREIMEQNLKEFQFLSNVTKFESVVVLFDSLYNARAIVDSSLVSSEYDNFHSHHIIGISDFEYFCDCQKEKESMFSILKKKRKKKKYCLMDFREYLLHIFPNPKSQISMHEDVFEQIFSGIAESDA